MKRLIAHLLGDYVVQSDWMARSKTGVPISAGLHGATYAACFLPLTRNLRALTVIGATHAVIDHYRLARYLVWARNQISPASERYPLAEAGGFGQRGRRDLGWAYREVGAINPTLAATDPDYYRELVRDFADRAPLVYDNDWLHGWLLFIADNTIHLLINEWALDRWEDQ